MKEVVKKEILKWLDAGIIYPISDSSWVSPVQCVPKKGDMTVVANEKNELIPTRTLQPVTVRVGMSSFFSLATTVMPPFLGTH